MNDIPLHGKKDEIHVNYFCKKVLTTDPTGKEIIRKTESWVTDLEVNRDNVALFVKGAKSRWKIENGCFNTLKNQSYHLEHNYGHGEKHLAFNFYLLTMLAFLFHQIFELSDANYQASRLKAGSKRSLWEKLRTFINAAVYSSWEQLLEYFLHYQEFNIIDCHVIERIPEEPPP